MRSHREEIISDIEGTWLVVFNHLVQDASRGHSSYFISD